MPRGPHALGSTPDGGRLVGSHGVIHLTGTAASEAARGWPLSETSRRLDRVVQWELRTQLAPTVYSYRPTWQWQAASTHWFKAPATILAGDSDVAGSNKLGTVPAAGGDVGERAERGDGIGNRAR